MEKNNYSVMYRFSQMSMANLERNLENIVLFKLGNRPLFFLVVEETCKFVCQESGVSISFDFSEFISLLSKLSDLEDERFSITKQQQLKLYNINENGSIYLQLQENDGEIFSYTNLYTGFQEKLYVFIWPSGTDFSHRP